MTMEAIGDITASAEVSRQKVAGNEFDSRIQGGILSDGLGGFFSALFTVTPLSIFSKNNGVIAITRCANRGAGRWCCCFLIVESNLGRTHGYTESCPRRGDYILFLSVAISGLSVLAHNRYTRRDRFVIGAALSFGFANLLQPEISTHLFGGVVTPNKGSPGLFDSISIILSTPCKLKIFYRFFEDLILIIFS